MGLHSGSALLLCVGCRKTVRTLSVNDLAAISNPATFQTSIFIGPYDA